jgi:hypothetical protein
VYQKSSPVSQSTPLQFLTSLIFDTYLSPINTWWILFLVNVSGGKISSSQFIIVGYLLQIPSSNSWLKCLILASFCI